jgi:transcriptional regulator with XRE-family HTH domain
MSRPLSIPTEFEVKIENDLKNIISFLVSKRQDIGLTQAEVAQKMGCEITTIQAIENNRKVPSTKTLLLMMRVLKVKFEMY